ncbi:MAG: GTPase [Nanoarchaeota archaeon]|nr:50S ribosome-binding GTPase [Nanoarchaeota archaeon]
MSSTNQSPEYQKAEADFLTAKSNEEKVNALEIMIKECPKHKSSEKMLANLKTRYKKLKEKLEKDKKQKKGTSSKKGIKKEGIQIILAGLTNSGKSSLISKLTNASPQIAEYEFTTKQETIGTLDYKGLKFQIIDVPAVNYESFDQGLSNTCDILLIIITAIKDIEIVLPYLEKSCKKRIIVFNKSDLLNSEEKRKIKETLKSKKYNFCMISCKNNEGLDELKEKLLENSGVMRIYTKEPKKQISENPIIMKQESSIKELSKKIFHSSIKIKEIKITGPSSKFPNQKVSLKHILKDKDIVEFKVD